MPCSLEVPCRTPRLILEWIPSVLIPMARVNIGHFGKFLGFFFGAPLLRHTNIAHPYPNNVDVESKRIHRVKPWSRKQFSAIPRLSDPRLSPNWVGAIALYDCMTQARKFIYNIIELSCCMAIFAEQNWSTNLPTPGWWQSSLVVSR